MTAATANTYDRVPYRGRSHPQTHPDAAATLATLMGLRPAPVAACRVLEIGCGTGGNLAPMAAALPGSRFVGVDLSAVQVAEARGVARDLGLANLEYREANILDLGGDLGAFDYVIAHGVYSWVPPPVQDGLLAACGRLLAPHGVAHVSYNTYPGWHLRAVARDAMLLHARNFDDPADQVRAGREYLKFLAGATLLPDGSFGKLLKEEEAVASRSDDYYLFHEHLEADNRPVYFLEFAARAAAHGLQYLGECVPHRPLAGLPEDVQRTVRDLSTDLLHMEQHVDFLRNRTFRRTLLCRADVAVDRSPQIEVLDGLLASAAAVPQSVAPDVASTEAEEFAADAGKLSTNIPLVKGLFVALARAWPDAVPVPEALAAAAELAGVGAADSAAVRVELVPKLLDFYLAGLVKLHTYRPTLAPRPSARPVGLPIARLQAADRGAVANAWHHDVRLGPVDRFVLPLLDGTRDRDAVAAALAEAVAAGAVPAPDGDGNPAAWADDVLARLGKAAVLVA